MSLPSERELMDAFKIRERDAKQLHAAMLAASNSNKIHAAFWLANQILNGHGIEVIAPEGPDGIRSFHLNIIAEYVNMGDPYKTTIIHTTEFDDWTIGSWGDFYENWERVNSEHGAGLSGHDEDEAESDEPEEDDISTGDHYRFYQNQKLWLEISRDATEAEMWRAIDAKMKKEGFFPNVWFISDHGNAHRMRRP